MSLVITKDYPFSKVGMNEVKGLETVLRALAKPVLEDLKSKIYWDESLSFEPAEYRSRDGFIPYSHNHGGLQLHTVIPSCEQYEFSCLEFGECDEEYCDCHKEDSQECALEIDGHKDAALNIWLKFEGLSETGMMQFYFVVSGGNGDAPYFRESHLAIIFEESFEAKSFVSLHRKGQAVIKRMLKVLNGDAK